ncbi:hypothetical protein BH10PSE4_BH10PSE4_25670 [soil metagenome]
MPVTPSEADIYDHIVTAGGRTELGPGTAAALALGAYKRAFSTVAPAWPTVPPAGWTFVLADSGALSGYDGYALIHQPSNTLVVGNRGTEGSRSLTDWLEDAGDALFDRGKGQMADALAFLVRAVQTAAPARIDKILAVGHSLGAALAELQASLGRRVLQNAGLPPAPIAAIGFGSAGFKSAIFAYAGTFNLTIDPGAPAACVNYTRARDAVHVLQPRWAVMGSVVPCASVYTTILSRTGNPKDQVAYFQPTADLLENHRMDLYCGWWQLGADHHLYRPWRTKAYEVREGAEANWRPSVGRPAGA